MRILNKTRGFVISEDAGVVESFFERLLGLTFSEPRDLVLICPEEDKKSSSIHMCFMRFPVDVLWLDSKKGVVDIGKKVPPISITNPKTWRIYTPEKSAKFVVEIGAGDIGKTDVGDTIGFS